MHFKSNNEDAGSSPCKRVRIAIVDDDASVRQAIERLCRSAGYETECFESAEAYLAADRGNLDGCLILDLQLPGMNGLDLHAEMLAAGTATPVVMVSGCTDGNARMQALENGAMAFLHKPFAIEKLLDAIRTALSDAVGSDGCLKNP